MLLKHSWSLRFSKEPTKDTPEVELSVMSYAGNLSDKLKSKDYDVKIVKIRKILYGWNLKSMKK